MKRDFTERLDSLFEGSSAITGFARWFSGVLSKIFQEGPLRPLKLLLNGTILEHPLHPLLTDVPIGAWTLAILLDLIALIFRVPNLGFASAIAVALGTLAALGAIASGLMDWMDVDPPEMAVGTVHGIVNSVATLLFAISFFLRLADNWAITLTTFLPALVGYGIVAFGAYLGGTLVYRLGTMINRDAYRSGPKDFVSLMPLDSLPENKPMRCDANGQPVLLVRRGQTIYAIGAVCSHYGGPLEKGKLMDGTVQCPWHYSRFALLDGSCKEGPATSPVPAYEARVNNGQVEVRARK